MQGLGHSLTPAPTDTTKHQETDEVDAPPISISPPANDNHRLTDNLTAQFRIIDITETRTTVDQVMFTY